MRSVSSLTGSVAVPRVSAVEGATIVSSRGKLLGTVSEVLFHPSEPRAIGVSVTRPRMANVIARAPMYVPLTQLTPNDDGFALDAKSLPSESDGARVLGYSWDVTVQWSGMPVRSADGGAVGAVDDVTFALKDGSLSMMRVSTGILGDVAVGRLEVPGELVEGFDGGAVIISARYADLQSSGGAAKAAAKGAAVAKDAGAKVAKQAYDAGMSAAIAVGKSFKSGTGRRMLDKFKEMTRDDDE